MTTLDFWMEEPTIRTGHRENLNTETYSYYLTTPNKPQPNRQCQRILAYIAMDWAFQVLPQNARVCDAHLLLMPHSSKSRLIKSASIYGHQIFPHVVSNGVAILASTSKNLVDFLLEEVGNDDDLYLRPVGRADVPDSQPWMIRDQKSYIENAAGRYGAVLLFCLTPISFEIVSVKPIANLALSSAREIAKRAGVALHID
jgi:hypothetical protein